VKYQIETTVRVTLRTIVDVDPYDDRDLDDILEEVADNYCEDINGTDVIHVEADWDQPTCILDDDENFVRWT
jgi:hypothetical protein